MEDVKPTLAELGRVTRRTRFSLMADPRADAPSTPKKIKLEPAIAHAPDSVQRVEAMLPSSSYSPVTARSGGVTVVRSELKKTKGVKSEAGPSAVVKQEPGVEDNAEASGSGSGSCQSVTVLARVKEEREEVSYPAGSGGSQVAISAIKLEPRVNYTEAVDEKPDFGKGKGKEKEKKPKAKKKVVPKRPMRWRKRCPVATNERLDRVMSQRMFLLDRQSREPGARSEEYKILGSTGNVYTVTVCTFPQCDCPDARNGNVPCKHIIFVFIKVLKIAPSSELWYQPYLTDEELDIVFTTAPPAAQGSSEVPARARAAWLRASGQEHLIPEADREPAPEPASKQPEQDKSSSHRKEAVGEDCPVCYEEMSAEDVTRGLLVWDDGLYGCGRALHSECFGNWSKSLIAREGSGAAITCVFCRGAWPTPPADGAGASSVTSGAGYTSTGYLNIAELVGVSRKRDTSSYYWGPIRGRRMDEARYED